MKNRKIREGGRDGEVGGQRETERRGEDVNALLFEVARGQ